MTPLEKYRLALTEFRVWKAKEFPPGTRVRVDRSVEETTVQFGDFCMVINSGYYELKPDEILVLVRGFHDVVNMDDITKL